MLFKKTDKVGTFRIILQDIKTIQFIPHHQLIYHG